MHAVVEIAGTQFDIKPKDVVKVPLLQANPGDVVEFTNILLAGNETETLVGTPYLNGTVKGTVIEHFKDKKVLIFKKKRRKGYRKFNGHRQQFSRIAITSMELDGVGSFTGDLAEIVPNMQIETKPEKDFLGEIAQTTEEEKSVLQFDDVAVASEDTEE